MLVGVAEDGEGGREGEEEDKWAVTGRNQIHGICSRQLNIL